ncbi:MAG: hypothetical protein AAB733_01370 [Patescibacteria group bacterium]
MPKPCKTAVKPLRLFLDNEVGFNVIPQLGVVIPDLIRDPVAVKEKECCHG